MTLAATWIPDATAVRDFRQSPERFRLKHRLHLRRAGWDFATDAGRAFHKALDAWFGPAGGDVEAAVAALHAVWDGPPEGLGDGGRRPLSLMERTLRAYCAKWPREADGFAVTATERYVEGRIARAGVAFDWCGIIDRELDDGTRAIMDTKTTNGWFHTPKTEGFFLRHEVGEAMLGYLALLQALDSDVAVYYIDAVHLNEDGGDVKPERDFRRWRCPGVVQGWRLDRWARDIAWTLDEIKRLEDARGIDAEWPLYTNWGFNKPDEFTQVALTPPELRAGALLAFERRPWVPREAV